MKKTTISFFILFSFALQACELSLINPQDETSSDSNSQSETPSSPPSSTGLNLVVPIEIIPTSFGSRNSGALDMTASRFSYDTNDYDGVVSTSIQINAVNNDFMDRQVIILDSGTNTVGTVNIPGNTSDITRITGTFTPNTGSDTYYLRVPQTTNSSEVIINNARVLVEQSNADFTKIYVPLDGDISTNITSDQNFFIIQGNSTGFVVPDASKYTLWRKDSSAFADLAASNPYTLEVVLRSSNGASTATAALFNFSTGNQVTGASVSTAATTPTLVQTSFNDNATNFNDGDQFEVRANINPGGMGRNFHISKSGLWIKLENLTKGRVYYRLARPRTLFGAAYHDDARAQIDTSSYSNPTVAFETVAYTSANGTYDVILFNGGNNDSGTGLGIDVTGSTNAYDNITTRTYRRSGALSITDGARYYVRIDMVDFSLFHCASFLTVDFTQ